MKPRSKIARTHTHARKRLAKSALKRCLVAATVHSLAGLRLAAKLKKGDVDILELRLDALASELPVVRRTIPSLQLPLLITARHPAEGGIGNLSLPSRRGLLAEFLPSAALIDVELRSVQAMRDLIAAAQSHGTVVVVSDHHFESTPSLARMLDGQRRAFAAGADVFKLAAVAKNAGSMARLLEFATQAARGPRAVMGMGRFGQVSRLVLAQAGSVLNYGYLDKPNAPGQWEAKELRQLLNRIGS